MSAGSARASFPRVTRGRPEGVTRLAMRMIEGRAGWSGVEPQAQFFRRVMGTAYSPHPHPVEAVVPIPPLRAKDMSVILGGSHASRFVSARGVWQNSK